MAFSALAQSINARNLSGESLIDLFTRDFSSDSMHFVNANNSQPLDLGIQALPMGKAQIKGNQNKAIGDAIGQGVKAMKALLPDEQGWVGAVRGPFSKASKETRTPYLVAHAAGVEVFRASLVGSGAFPERVTRTDEEKAQAKKEKAEKAEKAQSEAMDAARAALMASGEFIARADVLTIDKLATSALIDELVTRTGDTISSESLALLTAFTESINLSRMKAAGMV